jgi:hypothetical protein
MLFSPWKSMMHCCECVLEELAHIRNDIKKILRWIALKDIDFIQDGGCMPTDFSVIVGTTGSFAAVLNPPNGTMSGVPLWSASDASVVLSPAADGLSCVAGIPAGFTAASFTLTLTAISSDTSIGTLTASHNIRADQPTPPALSAIDFIQVS